MNLKLDRVARPIRKLRKVLKGFPKDPQPEQVHTLRTQARRLEAIFAVLMLQEVGEPRRLLRLVTPLRKAAGHVRDMDVLIGKVVTLEGGKRPASLVRLVEALAEIRRKRAIKLSKVVTRKSKIARRRLKRCARLIRSEFTEERFAGELRAGPQILITELRHWPRLDESNLHLFRIKVKALGYMLQLSQDTDGRLLRRLGEVKDVIGEWHDWTELRMQAGEVLKQDQDGPLLQQIETIQRRKLQAALASANALRRDDLDVHRTGERAHSLQKAAGF